MPKPFYPLDLNREQLLARQAKGREHPLFGTASTTRGVKFSRRESRVRFERRRLSGYRCRRCGEPIYHEHAIQLGYGARCLQQAILEGEVEIVNGKVVQLKRVYHRITVRPIKRASRATQD